MKKEKIFKIITSIKFLFSLALISLINMLINDFYLFDIEEKFVGGAKIGNIFYQLSLAYIGSFIFYFIVIYLKEKKDKHLIEPYISLKILAIITNGKILIKVLNIESSVLLKNEYPTKNEMKEMCSKIDPNNKIKGWYNTTWIRLCKEYRKESEIEMKSVYEKITFLDSKLVRLLTDIQTSSYYNYYKFENGNNDTTHHKDLNSDCENLYLYIELIKQLEIYAEKNLIGFRKVDLEKI
ncbi:hypothetical protein E0I26_01325 [Flavobacterium rhamnosiphilum]|uniref:Uncharacterized protein n=1 Tax=Flavobacterium rhamnosiphilum TaxID=2541724 RepID=A0A4R5FC49_9FLAO|nr:hypothetical protein [Flavobacterium rhamnosiphilum]TDE46752.1 hypothetical protein E0I26_01325 [Flavobacterium rhamnosiphilum]